MQYIVCCVHDRTSDTWSLPLFYRSEAEALRHFSMQINSSDQTPMSFAPEDFSFWCIGSYDAAIGSILAHKESYKLASGDSVCHGGTMV